MAFHSLEQAKEYRGPRILHTGRKFCLWDRWLGGGGLGLELMLEIRWFCHFGLQKMYRERCGYHSESLRENVGVSNCSKRVKDWS